MLIVDTHCHALSYWFEPAEVLLHQMHANGVEWAERELSTSHPVSATHALRQHSAVYAVWYMTPSVPAE